MSQPTFVFVHGAVPGSDRFTLDTSHSPFLSRSDAVTDILLGLVSRAAV